MLSESNYNALKQYRGGLHTGPKVTDTLLYFHEQGYITPVTPLACYNLGTGKGAINPTEWKLTPKGDDALAEFEYVHGKDAQEDSEKKADKKFQVLLVFLGALVGLFVEHFSGITEWFVSLF